MAVTPLWQLQRRIPTAGRIRLGQKGEKGQPQKLSRFRFTSANKEAIVKIAALYGGVVRPWQAAPTPGQFQVTIEAEKVRITLPPEPLGDGPVYELWSGGGCQRRCDGEECVTPASPEPVPCICNVQGRLECKVTTRLNVILRDVPFAGVWRLESHGWNAAHELPGMVDLVLMVQSRGLAVGELAVEERKQVQGRQTRRFNVPVVTAGGLSIDELGTAAGSVASLGVAPVRELEAPSVDDSAGFGVGDDAGGGGDPVDAGDEPGNASEIPDEGTVEDAVIVEEEPDGETPATPPMSAPSGSSSTIPDWLKAFHAMIGDLTKLDDMPLSADEYRHALVMLVTGGTAVSSKALNGVERKKAFDITADLLEGARRYIGVKDGRLQVSARRAEQ